MNSTCFREIWPYFGIVPPQDVSALTIDELLKHETGDLTSVRIQKNVVVEAHPESPYSLLIVNSEKRAAIFSWSSENLNWNRVCECETKVAEEVNIAILLKTLILKDINSLESLEDRLESLFSRERQQLLLFRFIEKLLWFVALITLFLSIRIGVDSRNLEAFVLLAALSLIAGIGTVVLKNNMDAILRKILSTARAQFIFENSNVQQVSVRLPDIEVVMQKKDQSSVEPVGALMFVVLLLIAYFLSTLVLLAAVVIFCINICLYISISRKESKLRSQRNLIEKRVANALLSSRANADAYTPKRLREAKLSVLRSRMHDFDQLNSNLSSSETVLRLLKLISFALPFTFIFGSYFFSASGLEKIAIAQEPFFTSSLITVAPVIFLVSISGSVSQTASIVAKRILSINPRRQK